MYPFQNLSLTFILKSFLFSDEKGEKKNGVGMAKKQQQQKKQQQKKSNRGVVWRGEG